jgi:hypothetical protein
MQLNTARGEELARGRIRCYFQAAVDFRMLQLGHNADSSSFFFPFVFAAVFVERSLATTEVWQRRQ